MLLQPLNRRRFARNESDRLVITIRLDAAVVGCFDAPLDFQYCTARRRYPRRSFNTQLENKHVHSIGTTYIGGNREPV